MQPGKTTIEDNSSNGTFVNSEKVEKGNTVPLKSNDAVGLCGPVTDRTAEYFGYILQVLTEVESSAGASSSTTLPRK